MLLSPQEHADMLRRQKQLLDLTKQVQEQNDKLRELLVTQDHRIAELRPFIAKINAEPMITVEACDADGKWSTVDKVEFKTFPDRLEVYTVHNRVIIKRVVKL